MELLADHAEGDHLIAALLRASRAGDQTSVGSCWRDLEKHIMAHMSHEEHVLLPLYALVQPDEVAAIIDGHTELRVQLKRVRQLVREEAATTEDFMRIVNAIHMHHAHEEVGLYRWAASRADAD